MLTETVVSVAAGVVFGLALAAPPGPMNAIIAEESVFRGWLAGFRAGLGAMAADLLFFVLVAVGVVTVIDGVVRSAMVTVGGLLMLYFGIGALRAADETLTGEGPPETARSFTKTFVLGLTNPYQILFWLTVGVGLLNPGKIDILGETPYVGTQLSGALVVETGSPGLLLGLFGGIICWIITFPALLVAGNDRVDSLAPVVAVGSALVLFAFGVGFVYDGVVSLL